MMPSGTYVTAFTTCSSAAVSCVMHVTVYPSSDPDSVSEGLCGNANNNQTDDFKLRDSETFDISIEPVLLAGSYL